MGLVKSWRPAGLVFLSVHHILVLAWLWGWPQSAPGTLWVLDRMLPPPSYVIWSRTLASSGTHSSQLYNGHNNSSSLISGDWCIRACKSIYLWAQCQVCGTCFMCVTYITAIICGKTEWLLSLSSVLGSLNNWWLQLDLPVVAGSRDLHPIYIQETKALAAFLDHRTGES